MTRLPRIESVTVTGPTALGIRWRAGHFDRIDLAGWIASGDDHLAPLAKPDVFARAALDEYGSAVVWGGDGDLAIDALHLSLLSDAQRKAGEP